MSPQHVTLDQLARLYQARNEANGRMSQALRSKDATLIRLAKEDATRWNQAYDDARKAWKKQQKRRQRVRFAQAVKEAECWRSVTAYHKSPSTRSGEGRRTKNLP